MSTYSIDSALPLPKQSKCKTLGLAFLGLAIVPLWPATAAELIDPLDNLNLTSGHSDNMILDTTSPEYFRGDRSRAKRQTDTPETLYYHVPNATSFTAHVFYYQQPGEIEVYASHDGSAWKPVRAAFTAPINTIGTWFCVDMTPEGDLPRDTNYLGFTLHSGPIVYTPQLGQISITYEPELTGLAAPSGLSALSAGGQAYIHWLPSITATSYTLRRWPKGKPEAMKIIGGLTSSHYLDSKLDPEKVYAYSVSASSSEGRGQVSDHFIAAAAPGAVVFSDPLIDWSLASDHTPGITLVSDAGDNWVSRSTAAPASFEYNVPGAATYAFEVRSHGDIHKEIAVYTSRDGVAWEPVSYKACEPVTDQSGAKISDVTADGPLPTYTNFIRIALTGEGHADTQVGSVRMIYGVAGKKSAAK